MQSQGGCSLFRISFHHLYCYYILNKQNHFLRGKCQSHCNHIVCFSVRGCPCDLHSFLPSSSSNWPPSLCTMGSTAKLSGKGVFFSDKKEALPIDIFSLSFGTHPEYFMAEAFSLVKEKFSLDLPKSRKQQTHKTFSDSGRAAEDALRDSAGHCPLLY